jgi:hypothetical protein
MFPKPVERAVRSRVRCDVHARAQLRQAEERHPQPELLRGRGASRAVLLDPPALGRQGAR